MDAPLCSDCAIIIASDDDSGIEDASAHRARMIGSWIVGDFLGDGTGQCGCCATSMYGARWEGFVIEPN